MARDPDLDRELTRDFIAARGRFARRAAEVACLRHLKAVLDLKGRHYRIGDGIFALRLLAERATDLADALEAHDPGAGGDD